MSMPPPTVIVNPHSANGSTARDWPSLELIVRGTLGPVEVRMTPGPDTAGALAREALKRGAPLIVAVGGDGTLNEIVGGFFEADGKPVAPAAALAVVSRGTGADFIKTLGIPRDPKAAVEVAAKGRRRLLDVGRISLHTQDGRPRVRHFINIADFGLGGETVARVNRTTKLFGGFVSFLWGATVTLLTYKPKRIRLRLDDLPEEEVLANNIVVANGQFFGGGMRIAPRAVPDDGFFDVVLVERLGVLRWLRAGGKLYRGTHLWTPGIRYTQARRLEAMSRDTVLLDVDGEQPGRLPARFELLPKALPVMVPGHP